MEKLRNSPMTDKILSIAREEALLYADLKAGISPKEAYEFAAKILSSVETYLGTRKVRVCEEHPNAAGHIQHGMIAAYGDAEHMVWQARSALLQQQ